MARIAHQPDALVVILGDRLWAQLDAVAQWGRGVSCIFLLPAHGDDVPGGPLERFETFLVTHFPEVEVRRLGPVNDDDPADVAAAVRPALIAANRCLVDASGGTRLMFAGLLDAAARTGSCVVYRSSKGVWYQLDSGRARTLQGLLPNALDRFQIGDLLAVTWAHGDRTARVSRTRVEPAIAKVAAKEVERPDLRWADGFWGAVTELRARSASLSAGALFEHYVVAVLHNLGFEAEDLTVGVKLQDEGVALQEVDVVVNSGGWLHVIDCKLTSNKRSRNHHPVPLGTQIREAFATKRHLGDGGNRLILLRPFLMVPQEFHDLCAEYGVSVVDKTVMRGRSLSQVLAEHLLVPSAGQSQSGRTPNLFGPESSNAPGTH